MKAVGRLRLPSTTGYSIAFAETIPTPTGRKIALLPIVRLRLGRAEILTRSKDYDLTTGEIEINEQDMKKSTGVMYPIGEDRPEQRWTESNRTYSKIRGNLRTSPTGSLRPKSNNRM